MIRSVKLSDAGSICDIYNEYIEHTWITFEEQCISANDIASRISRITEKYPWLVYDDEGSILGYAYADRWKERASYRHAVEIAIYLNSDHTGQGIGTKLLGALIDILKEQSYHSAIYGVSLPNTASIALCEKFGFKKIAHFKEVGYKLEKWIDVGYWELIL